MTNSYRRRIEALEQTIMPAVMEQAFDRQLQALWLEVERIAADGKISPHKLADAMLAGRRRRVEIGTEAYEREGAADIGVTVEQLHDPAFMRARREEQKREWDAWQEKVRVD